MKPCKSKKKTGDLLKCILKQRKECIGYQKFKKARDDCEKSKCSETLKPLEKLLAEFKKTKNKKTLKKMMDANRKVIQCRKKKCPEYTLVNLKPQILTKS